MDQSTLKGVSTARRVALAAVIFLSIGAWGFIQPLIPLFLSASGMDRQQIGLISGIGTGLALLAQPLWGRWSDALDARRPFMVGTALVACAAYACFHLVRSPLLFTLLTALGVNGFLYLQAAAGVLAGRIAPAGRGGSSYAGFRFWGSAGYLVVALSAGWMLQNQMSSKTLSRADVASVMMLAPLLFGLAALVSCAVPDPKRIESKVAVTVASAPMPPQVLPFLWAFGLYNFALYGMLSYLSLFLEEVGATPMLVLGTWAAGVVAEMLMMTQSGRFADRFGRRPLLAIPFFVLPLRLALLVPATGGWWVLGVQTLEAFCFGVMGIVAVAYINDLADESNRGVLQARLFAVLGFAMATSPIVAGALAERFELRGLFAILSVVALGAAVLFWRCVSETLPTRTQSTLRAGAAL